MTRVYRTLLVFHALLLSVIATAAPAKPIVVAGKDFTEQAIVVELTRQLLEAKGFAVEKQAGLPTDELHRRANEQSIDVYWEYTTTRLLLNYGERDHLGPEAGYARVKALDAARGLIWLGPSSVNNTYALALRAQTAEQLGIATLSDLAAHYRAGGALKLGLNEEFAERPDGLVPMERAYGFAIPGTQVQQIESDRIYQALRVNWIDVGLVFTTDGRIAAYDLRVLDDDKRYFSNYILAPVVRQEIARANPGLVAALEALAARLDNRTMTRLNAEADIDRHLIRTIASDFLREAGIP